MGKHIYRSKKVNDIDWERLEAEWKGKPLVLAVDIAKETQYAELSADGREEGTLLLRWGHLGESPALIAALRRLGGPVAVVMEPSGTYGDSLRHLCREAGFGAFLASAKRAHDAREVFDGVPSLHDGKSARLIGSIHRAGLTRPWPEPTEKERALAALRRTHEMRQGQRQRGLSRPEAQLARHWPEARRLLDLDSVSLEQALKQYGPPRAIAADPEGASALLRRVGGPLLAEEKVRALAASAAATLGQPCAEAEAGHLRALACELEHSRLGERAAARELEAMARAEKGLAEAARTAGLLTLAVLLGLGLDPRRYGSAKAYRKALGLNLKEKSSGQHQGKLKLTKRGSGTARKYLCYAALRLLRDDPAVAGWYAAKKDGSAKLKAVAALMRKLALALWHVARGQAFDAGKLLAAA